MKYVKFECGACAPRFEVSEENFENQTQNRPPWQIEPLQNKNIEEKKEEDIKRYAICPHCENPVRLIGLYKKTHTQTHRKPYGAHTGKSIEGLPKHVQNKYEFCPFASHRKLSPDPEERILVSLTPEVIEQYNLLREQFDRAAYIIDRMLHMRLSANLYKKALDRYVASHGYRYPYSLPTNLPLMVCYFGLAMQNIYGQRIEVGSPLYKAIIKECPEALFVPSNTKGFEFLRSKQGEYLPKLKFRFLFHERNARDGDVLVESLEYNIDRMTHDGRLVEKTIHKERIKLDELFFFKLINKKENDGKRNEELLEIAEEVMTPNGLR